MCEKSSNFARFFIKSSLTIYMMKTLLRSNRMNAIASKMKSIAVIAMMLLSIGV